jgi:hypothetical protein
MLGLPGRATRARRGPSTRTRGVAPRPSLGEAVLVRISPAVRAPHRLRGHHKMALTRPPEQADAVTPIFTAIGGDLRHDQHLTLVNRWAR